MKTQVRQAYDEDNVFDKGEEGFYQKAAKNNNARSGKRLNTVVTAAAQSSLALRVLSQLTGDILSVSVSQSLRRVHESVL
jgi:hypothetical protein